MGLQPRKSRLHKAWILRFTKKHVIIIAAVSLVAVQRSELRIWSCILSSQNMSPGARKRKLYRILELFQWDSMWKVHPVWHIVILILNGVKMIFKSVMLRWSVPCLCFSFCSWHSESCSVLDTEIPGTMLMHCFYYPPSVDEEAPTQELK